MNRGPTDRQTLGLMLALYVGAVLTAKDLQPLLWLGLALGLGWIAVRHWHGT